jgi:hypothetical protein
MWSLSTPSGHVSCIRPDKSPSCLKCFPKNFNLYFSKATICTSETGKYLPSPVPCLLDGLFITDHRDSSHTKHRASRNMDPITAIGLAAAVVDFVGFSWGLVTGAREIYRSANGTLDENAHLEDIMVDLDSIADDLNKTSPGRTRAERAIKQLAGDCQVESAALLDILRKLKVRGKKTVWKSLKAKFASLLAKDDVNELKDRLQEYRSEITTNLILVLR